VGGIVTLPPLTIEVTPTLVIAGALATRDFQDVHHDRDRAVSRGSKDIFLNILTTTGLVQRYVLDCYPPTSVICYISLKLGVPCYADDTLTFTGRVVSADGDVTTVEVIGTNSLGAHVTATVGVRQ
jgi:3-oxo-4,17-pregnadiene-20-carboxyl-CoA hydratase beta subunit